MKVAKLSLFISFFAIKIAFSQGVAIDKLRSDSNVTGLQLVWIDKNKTIIQKR